MKSSIITALILSVTAMSMGCSSEGYRGNTCVGFGDPDERDDLDYKFSAWNITMGVLFSWTIIVPIYVLVDEVKCPVGPKTTSSRQ